MTGLWKINDTDIYATYGAAILRGSYNELLAPPKPRKRLEHEYTDQNGVSVDTATPLTYEPKRFNIKIGIYAKSTYQFWTNYNALIAAMAKPGTFSLYIADLGRSYELIYEGATVTKKVTPILNAQHIAVELSVALLDPAASMGAITPDMVKVTGNIVEVVDNPGGVISELNDVVRLTLTGSDEDILLTTDETFSARRPESIFLVNSEKLYLTF